MIAFIDEYCAVHGVEPICRVLPIAPSTYHAHAARRTNPGKLPPQARRDITLKTEIRRVYEENFRVYGVQKVWRQLLREGISMNAAVSADDWSTHSAASALDGSCPARPGMRAASRLPEKADQIRGKIDLYASAILPRKLEGLRRCQRSP
jgi:hypothetical protein